MSARGSRRPVGALLAVLALGAVAACGGGSDDRDEPGLAPPPVPAARDLSPPAPGSTGGSGGSSTGGSGGDEDSDEGGGEPVNERGVEVDAQPGDQRLPAVETVACPAGGTTVTTAEELTAALGAAAPGEVIRIAPGTYEGTFATTASGRPDAPIWLCGGREAVLDGGGIKEGYVLHLDGATHWRVVGFSLRNGQKGLMGDGTVGSVVQDLSVSGIGDEAIHLRAHSTDNLVIGNQISGTGQRREKFGEGVYIGTAVSNWCTISDCRPDRSDRNVVAGNRISGTTSENIDIKEGTTGGLVVGNSFDGAATTAADSWVDVKGTAWTIRDNRGENAPLDGFQTHRIEDRWGERNLFTGNRISGEAKIGDRGKPGYGIALRPEADNIVRCDNTATGGIELANVTCG